MKQKETVLDKIKSTMTDGMKSVVRSSNGQIWVQVWDSCSGKRGSHILFREITASDKEKMISEGVSLSFDDQIISWAIKQS